MNELNPVHQDPFAENDRLFSNPGRINKDDSPPPGLIDRIYDCTLQGVSDVDRRYLNRPIRERKTAPQTNNTAEPESSLLQEGPGTDNITGHPKIVKQECFSDYSSD